MIAPLEKVKGMALIPHACVLCANNPVEEQTGEQQEAIFAPGVDVNWGDSVYICKSCVEIMADLFGRVTVEGFDKLTEKYETLREDHEALKKQHECAKALLDRIKDGKAALKEAQGQTRKHTKEKVS
jgi:hypothetical protein